MQQYSQKNVLKIFPGIEPSQLKQWVTLGLITPDLKSKAFGVFRRYSTINLVEIGVIRELFEFGLKHLIVESIIQRLREHIIQWEDYDLVLVYRRQYISAIGQEPGQASEIVKGKRSEFKYESGHLLFSEQHTTAYGNSGVPFATAAIVINVADIWDYIMSRL